MLRSKVSLILIAGAIAVSAPASPQEENPAYKNEASVRALGSFVKTTTSNGVDTMSVDPPAPSRALALYLASAAQGDQWSAPNGAILEIDAYLPRLGEEGHLRAIRAWAENKTPEYQVIHLDGDASVTQQVIARYLNAEQEAAAMPASSFAITPANYKFRYAGSGGGTPVYAFHITPRKKRSGLINGELWIDGATGVLIHEAGYLVKRPSIFIRHFKIAAGRLLLHYHRVPGQDASQIQRQYLFEFSHDQGSPFWICFTIERHHASDYLERYVCSKQRLFL